MTVLFNIVSGICTVFIHIFHSHYLVHRHASATCRFLSQTNARLVSQLPLTVSGSRYDVTTAPTLNGAGFLLPMFAPLFFFGHFLADT